MGDVVGLTPGRVPEQQVPGNRTADGLGRLRKRSPYRGVSRSERQSTHLRQVAVPQTLQESDGDT